MIAQASKPTRPNGTPASRAASQSPDGSRVEEVLGHEIPFVPSPAFRELDVDRAWQRDLAWLGLERWEAVGPDGHSHAMPAHLRVLCSAPLLSPEDEREFFCWMNYFKYRANAVRATLRVGRPNTRQLAQIDALLAASRRIRNAIVRANIRLVVSIVKQFTSARNSFDELLSEGIGCLLKAVEKFDYDRGFRFSTYATMAVRREVFSLIKKSHRQGLRFNPHSHESLDQRIGTEVEETPSEADFVELNQGMTGLIDQLDERERFIVQARYGFIDLGVKPTFSKLGKHLGVSKERVRQIEMRAMNKLRELVAEFRSLDWESWSR
jgi:RNA polymerase primary sigma factor